MKRIVLLLPFALLWILSCASLKAQDIPEAIGPGSYVAAGVGLSAFQADYGQRVLGGYMAFVDAHATWRYGFEAEARSLHYHTDEDVTQRTLMAGPHIDVWKPSRMRPYVKFLVGQGHIVFPFKYETGNYFAMAPGAGVDFMLNDVVSIRAIDVEYQDWPKFPYGALHPYGISAGIYIRLNPMHKYPRRASPGYKLR